MKKVVALLLICTTLFAVTIPAMACKIPGCECEEENECGMCHLCDYHYNVWWKSHTPVATKTTSMSVISGVNVKMQPCEGAELYEVYDVSTLGLNLREGPSTKDRVKIRVRNAGLLWVLDFVGENDEWAYVSYAPDRYGYVMSSYIKPAVCYCEHD